MAKTSAVVRNERRKKLAAKHFVKRQELVKIAHKYAEQAKVAVRHVRRDGLDHLKKMEKDGQIGEDEERREADNVQKLTDASIADIDKALATKEKEIMQV